MELFKERLKEIRLARSLSQNQLGDKLGYTSRGQVISFYESGKRNPGIESMVALCKALDVSADYLLGLDNEKEAG